MSYPLYLLSGLILYSLGVGIARFLAHPINWDTFWAGALWVLLFQASGHFLNAYFSEVPALGTELHSPFRGPRGIFGPDQLPRQVALWAAFVCLAITASLSVLMFQAIDITPIVLLLIMVLVLGEIAFCVPPFRQITFSYRELIVSIWIAALIPGFGYLLQGGDFHRFVAMASFPLVALHLAVTIVFALEDFALDIRYEIPSFLVRIGWQDGMNLHNYLIFGSYLLLLAGLFFGLPIGIVWPILITLPLAGYQVWTMLKIARGGRPIWRSLEISATALFLVVAYLIGYGFWTR